MDWRAWRSLFRGWYSKNFEALLWEAIYVLMSFIMNAARTGAAAEKLYNISAAFGRPPTIGKYMPSHPPNFLTSEFVDTGALENVLTLSGEQVTDRLKIGALGISLTTVNDVDDVVQKAATSGHILCRMLDPRAYQKLSSRMASSLETCRIREDGKTVGCMISIEPGPVAKISEPFTPVHIQKIHTEVLQKTPFSKIDKRVIPA
jgi:hypothetical protein